MAEWAEASPRVGDVGQPEAGVDEDEAVVGFE